MIKTLVVLLVFPFLAIAQNKDATAIQKSLQYQGKANWFRLMPHFNHDSTVFYFNQAINILQENAPAQNERLAEVYRDMTRLEYRSYMFASMDSLAQKGLFYYEKISSTERNIILKYNLLSTLALVKLEMGETKQSLEIFTQAISLFQNDASPKISAQLLKDKGNFYIRNGSAPQDAVLAKEPLLQSITFYSKENSLENNEALVQLYKLLEQVYDKEEKADSAFYCLDKMKLLLAQNQNPVNHAWYYAVLGRTILTYRPSEKGYEEARANILKAIDILEIYKITYHPTYPFCFGILADIALARHQYDEAIYYWDKTREIDLSLNLRYHAIGLLQLLSEAYEKKGDLVKALEYSRSFHNELIEYERESSEKGLRENELKLDVLAREKTINEKNAQRKSLMTLTIASILSLVLVIIVLIALYRNYTNKRKLNTQLETLNQDLEQKNIQLDKRNAENELLLKEIHHRVKNNLEIVSGLLELQAAQIDHPSAQAVMQASQNRVLSMGIIHQKLYQKGNLADIEMKDYFHNLGESILDTFSATNQVKIICDMQPLELDVDTAVPIGLIANELLCNALKYAFPQKQQGEIQISLKKSINEDELNFRVADNGIGKAENVISKGTGFGTELVNLLVQQLTGTLTVNNNNGTDINIRFKYTKPH